MALTAHDLLMDADAFRRAYPDWPHPEPEETEMTAATETLTRAEGAYAHLASFQRGDVVDVGGRRFFLPGTVTMAQQHDHSDINRAYLVVTGTATGPDGNGGWRPETIEVKVTVGSLLSGKHTITSLDDAKAGNVRHFDAATWAMQNPEG